MNTKKNKWEKDQENSTLKGEGFHISYNPSPTIGSNGCAETALVKDEKFYILDGDWRKNYEKIIDKGFDKCKEFFEKKARKHKSSWSN